MINIREFKKEDYKKVIDVLKEAELFDEVWESKENVFGMIQKDPESIFVAEADGKIVGNIFIISYGPKLHYIFRLAVRKDHRKKGIGSLLIQKAIEVSKNRGVKEVGMYVDSENTNLHSYYEKRGFKKSKKSYCYMWKED